MNPQPDVDLETDIQRMIIAHRNRQTLGYQYYQTQHRQPTGTREHGRYSTYVHGGCRCDQCRKANRERYHMRKAAT